MFNKTASARPVVPAPTASEAPRRAPAPSPSRAPSLLGADLVFEGAISGEGELHVEGTIRGDINIARLVVGERAQVEGVVSGGQIEVRGKVVGNIEAKAVKLYETAHVEGDIIHEQLSIDVGAFFQGRCQQSKRVAPQPVPVAAPTPVASAPSAQVIELDKSAG